MRRYFEEVVCDASGCTAVAKLDALDTRSLLKAGWIRADVPTRSHSSWVFEFCPLHGKELREVYEEREKTSGPPIDYIPGGGTHE